MPASGTMKTDINPPFEIQVSRRIGFLKRHKVSRPDGLSTFSFRDDGELSISELPKLLGPIQAKEQTGKPQCDSVIILSRKENEQSSSENHRGISLIGVASKKTSRASSYAIDLVLARCARKRTKPFWDQVIIVLTKYLLM